MSNIILILLHFSMTVVSTSFNLANPPAIIFVNDDLSSSIRATLTTQLQLSEIISGAEFDARVAADPNYPTTVHLNNLRLLVVRSLFDQTNRTLADIVLFIKAGLASILCGKEGPPKQTFPVGSLYINELVLHNPSSCQICCGCSSSVFAVNIANSNILSSTCVDPFGRKLDQPAGFPYGSYGYSSLNDTSKCLDNRLILPSTCPCVILK